MASSLLTSEFKIQTESLTGGLLSARNILDEACKALSPKEKDRSARVSPYYADLTQRRFAITSEELDTPYDRLVASVIKDDDTACFTVMPNNTVDERDQLVIKELSEYVGRLKYEPLDLQAIDSSLAPIFANFDFIVANCYYQSLYGIRPIGHFHREKKKSPVYRGPNAYYTSAVVHLERILHSPDKRILASSIVRLLIAMIEMRVDFGKRIWTSWISSRKSRIPTYEQLVFAGIAPDLKLKRFRTLFYQSEWDTLSREGIIDLETQISTKRRESVTVESIGPLLKWAEETKRILNESSLIEVAEVKQKRLNVAKGLKSSHRKLEHIVREGSRSETDRTYFTPFPIVTKKENFSVAECLSFVKQETESNVFYVNHKRQDVPLLVQAALLEFANVLSVPERS